MRRNTILIITFVWLGFIALIAQTISLREMLVIFFGNELCLGIIFTAWLAGITIGAFIASFITDKVKSSVSILIAILLLITLILPFQVYLIRISRQMLDIPLGQHIPFFETLYMSFLLVVPFSILIGIAFPVACKIYASENDSAQSIGWVYVWEAVGSLLAGILFTFWLVERFSAFEIIITSNLVTTLLLFFFAFDLQNRGAIILIVIYAIGFYIPFSNNTIGLIDNASIRERWNSIYKNYPKLVKSTDSKYGNIAIGELQEQYSLVENGKYVSSFPDEYTHAPPAHLFLTQHPQPKNILLIGGGIEGLLGEMLKYPIESLDYVQIDPKIIDIVNEYLPVTGLNLPSPDKRLQIHYVDGRRFVKSSSTMYDLVIINLPDPSTANINRFYTTDFFKEAKQCLNKGGVLATRCSSAVNYFGENVGNYTGSVYDSLSSVFKYVLVTPGTEAYFFASDKPDTITFDVKTLDKRFRASGVQSQYFISPASFEVMLQESQIKFTQETLSKRKTHYLNTDLKPITYFFNLVLWDTMTGESGTFFKTLSGIKFWWVILVIITLAAVRLGLLASFTTKESRQQHNALFSIFIIGLSGLSLELILIFAFQNIYGYLYQYIGFMIALFMAGLAVGGYLSNRMSARTVNPIKSIIIIHLALLILSFALPYLLQIIPSLVLIFALIVVIGLLTGMIYPLLSRIYIQSGAAVGKAAGLIDAFDHLGAGLGALFTGVLLIPLFGITQTCILIALLNLLTVIFIAIPLPQRYTRTP
ncbi:MAG: fused MFS/spermidine synthase [Planctomycetota bacterium]